MVAGGFGGGGLPLHARTTNAEPSVEPSHPGHPLRPPCPVRHCWVTAPVDGVDWRPGLLLEWRRNDAGRWEGRVSYAAELRPGRWATVEEWLPSEHLDRG